MDTGSIFFITLFALIAAIIIVPQVLRARDRARLHETLRLAYEKGQPVPPELVEALTTRRDDVVTQPTERSARDFRLGVVWLFVGLGFVAVGLAFYGMLYFHGGAVETLATFSALGAIPAFVGLAFLILSFFGRHKSH